MTAETLKEKFGDCLVENEPMARHTHFKIGGPAAYFLEAKNSDELVEAVKAARVDQVDVAVLGGGTNTLVSDEGFKGLVIKAANRNWKIDGTSAWAEAGVLSMLLARKTAEAGLSGFEWAVSLPGTVGGAVRGNAGCFGGEMKDVVASVTALDPKTGETIEYLGDECAFDYRHSVFKENGQVVLSMTLALKPEDKDLTMKRLERVLAQRQEEQPQNVSTAGCMFKNFEFKDEAEIEKAMRVLDIPKAFIDAKRIPAGWLIDQHDLKGSKIGKASVSEKHGNFLVTEPGAAASEVIQLTSLIKMKIRDDYGIQLEEEVQLLG